MDLSICHRCGFWDSDYGACTCPSTDRWYACKLENSKPENIKALKEYAEENHCKNDCDDCEYLDGDCCRLIYEEKEYKE